ncbi:MAG: hypothetical protein JXJ18_01080 [Rhodobacteraceae bacterium]|nr:hypothetical protein [Paracoccaceae bacterium]
MRLRGLLVAFGAIAWLLGTFALGYWGSRAATRDLRERTALVSPIVILDDSAALARLPLNADPEAIRDVRERLSLRAERLSAAGFVVIKRSSIVAAPEDLYVDRSAR